MLADFSRQPQALAQVRPCGGPAALRQLGVAHNWEDLREDPEHATGPRASCGFVLGAEDRLIIAEMKRGPAREPERHGLLDRCALIELLRQPERETKLRDGVDEVALIVRAKPDEQLHERPRDGRVIHGQSLEPSQRSRQPPCYRPRRRRRDSRD